MYAIMVVRHKEEVEKIYYVIISKTMYNIAF